MFSSAEPHVIYFWVSKYTIFNGYVQQVFCLEIGSSPSDILRELRQKKNICCSDFFIITGNTFIKREPLDQGRGNTIKLVCFPALSCEPPLPYLLSSAIFWTRRDLNLPLQFVKVKTELKLTSCRAKLAKFLWFLFGCSLLCSGGLKILFSFSPLFFCRTDSMLFLFVASFLHSWKHLCHPNQTKIPLVLN